MSETPCRPMDDGAMAHRLYVSAHVHAKVEVSVRNGKWTPVGLVAAERVDAMQSRVDWAREVNDRVGCTCGWTGTFSYLIPDGES